MDSCLSVAFDTCLHSLCGNIFFGFCDTTQVFFLPLFLLIFFAGSSSSTQLVCVGFFQGSLSFTFSCWLVSVSSSDFGLVYAVADWTSPGICFPNFSNLTHSQWNTWFPHQTISSFFHLITLVFTQLLKPDKDNQIIIFDSFLFLAFYSLSHFSPRIVTISRYSCICLQYFSLICPLCHCHDSNSSLLTGFPTSSLASFPFVELILSRVIFLKIQIICCLSFKL